MIHPRRQVPFTNALLVISWLLLCVFSPTNIGASTTGVSTNSPPTAFIGQQSQKTVAETTNTSAAEKDEESASDSEVAATINASKNIVIPGWKQALPPPLNNRTKTLQRIVVPGPSNRVVEVYLLGTAHVSKDSSQDVRLLLENIDPDVVFLELCDGRIPMLLSPPPAPVPSEEKRKAADNQQHSQQNKKGFFGWLRRPRSSSSEESPPAPPHRSMYGTAATLLTKMQQDYATSLDVELGGEFRVAYNYWDEHRTKRRLHMILGDRPLYLTLTRAWESLRLWGKTKLLIGLLISSLQKPKPEELRKWMEDILSDDSGDLLTESIAELAEHFPTLEEVIIQERDAYMACKLYQTCRELLISNTRIQKHRMVAIVGAGHVEGMCRWLTTANEETPEQILSSLIEIKKGIPEEDSQALVNDVLEVNHELLKAMIQES